MKQLIIISLFCILCFTISEAQTYAEIAGPENVLLVYNTRSLLSDSIMQYYRDARNIPSTNIVPLRFIADSIMYQGNLVTLKNSGEKISSLGNSAAWYYYKDRIADSIESHLTNTYVGGVQLKNKIRYIVLCKGVPVTIQTSTEETSLRKTVCLDAMLCLLYQDVLPLYNTYYSAQPNPYKLAADMNYTFNYRFITNHFTNTNGWKLNYLVSRLDGDNFEDVMGLINRSKNSDKSGSKYWIFDADTCHNEGVTRAVHNNNLMKTSLEHLKNNLFNTNPVQYDPDCNFISSNSIMGVLCTPTYEDKYYI